MVGQALGEDVRPSIRRHIADRPLLVSLGALALVSLLFLLAPELDIAVSALFFDPASGFLHERFEFVEVIRNTGRRVQSLFAVAVCVPLGLKLLAPSRPILLAPRATLFVLGTYLLGPGLVVNGILKEYWGRARPREIVEFGGSGDFSPVWWISDQCQGNCSFVSGEGASAFWILTLVFLVPKRFRIAAVTACLAFAAVVSWTRIAMGGHFISDVLISWLLTLLVMLVLNRLVLHGIPPAFDSWVEDRIGRAGEWLRALIGLRATPPRL